MALISWISGTFYNNRHEKLTREGVFYTDNLCDPGKKRVSGNRYHSHFNDDGILIEGIFDFLLKERFNHRSPNYSQNDYPLEPDKRTALNLGRLRRPSRGTYGQKK